MSPFSGIVLWSSLLISTPAMWMGLQGEMTLDQVVQRWAIVLGICWAAISVVAAFAFPPPGSPSAVPVDQTVPEDRADPQA